MVKLERLLEISLCNIPKRGALETELPGEILVRKGTLRSPLGDEQSTRAEQRFPLTCPKERNRPVFNEETQLSRRNHSLICFFSFLIRYPVTNLIRESL